jgi:hypothetical protein
MVREAETVENSFKVKKGVIGSSNLRVRAVTACGKGPYSMLL